ncbi:MAG: class I SAM-dependent DNA methyltransferase [Candidatus Competibacter sp.]|nr:class I SAM-dependent DNA methyltransferase [Candidatus Competibacter sp.]MDG4583584.1 class I SAM-dependent DNA methyltransferase [Candidatus Competibacter sp.]
MTPQFFIQKWRCATLTERAAAQSHFNDLCILLDEPTPTDADPAGEWFAFEKGAKKTGGGQGWADVWKKGCFAWEYKGKHKDLNAALRQLQQYALALDNPPLLIVCDLETIAIHTNFTNTVHTVHRLTLDDLADGSRRQLLKWAFADPDRLKPEQTTAAVTAQAAETFAYLAQRLRERSCDPRRVAHFVTRLLFCMFAEDIGLLPRELFTRLLKAALPQPERFVGMARNLFAAMSTGGVFGVEEIAWFNGGLFNDPDVIPLEIEELRIAHRAALLDWAAIEPAIFGTLFERGLDPDKRSQLGAHYTDRASIERLIAPVIREPLWAEWVLVRTEMVRLLGAKKPKRAQAEQALYRFLERLRTFRVLDPACGSGNFLYLALQTLKDLEHQVMLEAEELGLQRGFPGVGPEAVWGIEINPYAAELARVTVWIGEIQWMLLRGYNLNDQPILKPLEQIFCQDALLSADGAEAQWPIADVIVGNPPFLGGSKMLGLLGEQYTKVLRTVYRGRVPGGADLVCYWFEKARALVEQGKAQRAGLVATNSIRGGANRKVLERIINTPLPLAGEGPGVRARIFNAWSDEDWVNEGAAVRVSLVCFGNPPQPPFFKGGSNATSDPPLKKGGGEAGGILNGQPVAEIYADLTGRALEISGGVDLTDAVGLKETLKVAFIGTMKKGSFDVTGELARRWLSLPNPNGRPNSEVLFPWTNGLDITRRPLDMWIVDFGVDMPESLAALYELPFQHIVANVRPQRELVRNDLERQRWWLLARPSPDLRRAITGLSRFIVTPRVAKHRLFAWLYSPVICDGQLVVIARSDDTAFGILHSRFHELWALRLGTSLEDRPRYTPTTCFETFPFPEGLQPNIPASAYADDPRAQAIAEAACRLVELRDHWLNPPEWVKRVPEVVPGYPDRLLPVDDRVAAELKKRTLTNLYNQRPTWLANAHQTLDEAVAAAYGWPADLSDEEILQRLLALNRERANAGTL